MFSIFLMLALCPLSSCLYHQYHFVNMNMSWTEAQSYCRQNYTDLATIDSTEEMTRLISSVDTGYTGAAWIGLYNDVNSWRWSLDGRSLYGPGGTQYTSTFYNLVYFPETCVLIDLRDWFTLPCSFTFPFVCYDGRNTATQKYVLVTVGRTWSEAQRYCRANYTDLASIMNQSDNQQIEEMIENPAWIGLYSDAWKWSDGENATFFTWQTGMQNSPIVTNTCVVQWLSGEQNWSYTDCGAMHPFFCYSYITTTTTPSTTSAAAASTTEHMTATYTSRQNPTSPPISPPLPQSATEHMTTLSTTVQGPAPAESPAPNSSVSHPGCASLMVFMSSLISVSLQL